MSPETKLPDLDVAIVGGGISGIYTAWRLRRENPGGRLAEWAGQRDDGKLKVAVFERSNRIGGRLLSARSPKLPNATCELGGMRFIDPLHARVSRLVATLKLRSRDQVVYQASNIAFLRGRLLRYRQLGKPELLPFNLDLAEADWIASRTFDEKSAAPDDLIGRVLGRAIEGLQKHLEEHGGDKDKLYAFLEVAKVAGDERPLWQWGFWNLILRFMSPEAYKAARDTIGYDVLGANYNAVDMIAEILQFAPGIRYLMLEEGYQSLPWTLKTQFEDCGGRVETDHELSGFDFSESEGFSLRFSGSEDSNPVTARVVILAMPRRSLELIVYGSPPLKTWSKRYLLAAVEPIPLFKLFLIYERPWWEEAGVKAGRSLTDLPLRQCYYWPVPQAKGDAVSHEGRAALMVYNDALNVSFWRGLALPEEVAAPPRERFGGDKFISDPGYFSARSSAVAKSPGPRDYHELLLRNWEACNAQVPQVVEMSRQLGLVHGIDLPPEPVDAAVADWSQDPFGGGVHLWNVFSKSRLVMEEMIQPISPIPCYVCGEAYSTNQTWVEGALQTADLVLSRLGLPIPGGTSCLNQ